MGVINNEGLAELKGCLDEPFKVSGITSVNGGWGTTTNDGKWGVV